MKPLMPTLRERNRYVAIEYYSKNFRKEFEKTMKEYFGNFLYSKANISYFRLDNFLTITCSRRYLKEVLGTLALLPFPIKVIGISGTIKGLKRKISQRFQKDEH